jgi:N-acyl amino acid synthase of PEP-CTERM/exosortase system
VHPAAGFARRTDPQVKNITMNDGRFEIRQVFFGSSDYFNYLSLRHKVFCEELARVPAAARMDALGRRLESDCFDRYSLHLACRDVEQDTFVACGRLILPNPLGLNITRRYALDEKKPAEIVGEISRLAIATPIRRSRNASPQGLRSAAAQDVYDAAADLRLHRTVGSQIALFLYREFFRHAQQQGISYCYAAMEECLGRLLSWMGFPFRPIGPLNREVSPPRRPYLIGADALRTSLFRRNPQRFDFFFQEDALSQAAPATRMVYKRAVGES